MIFVICVLVIKWCFLLYIKIGVLNCELVICKSVFCNSDLLLSKGKNCLGIVLCDKGYKWEFMLLVRIMGVILWFMIV